MDIKVINGRYLLHRQIGEGGMGVVYLATDRLTQTQVAFKQVHLVPFLNFSSGSQQTTRDLRLALAQEFQLLAGLRHPHIVSVLDYGFDNDPTGAQRPYFTMNYLPQAQTILEAGEGQPLAYKLNLIQQLLQALAYLHRRGILHRDIKPANILVSDGVLRVLDFGLATKKKKKGGSSGGTPAYTPLEIWDGKPYTEAADLYAVGVTAYELLSGKHPFGPIDHMFIERLIDGKPDLDKLGVSEAVAAVINRLLAPEPTARFESANATLAALAAALGEPLPAETEALRESYLQAATFIGRNAEMNQLTDALAQAQAGQGSGWLIGGESGVGKSRLIAELRTQALVAGFLVLRGQSVEDGGLPYQLWRQPLRQLVSILPDIDDLTAGILLPFVPDIAQLLGRPVLPAPKLGEKAAQARLFVTMTGLFWQADRPLLLILEDLHWSEVSLLPLPYLLRSISEHTVLIIGSYRNDERPNLSNELANMRHLPLSRLSNEAMSDLSAAMLGEAGRDPAIQALLQRETEGNAFFAVEVVRALAEEAGRLGDIGKMVLPETLLPNGIQDIVQRRVDKLPDLAKALLVKTAVAGRELDLPLVHYLSGEIDVENEWLPLCADTALLDVQNGIWQFSHSKIRDGLLAELTATETIEQNKVVAIAIEQLYPDASQTVRLAHHWQEAQNEAKERYYAEIAGKQAAAQFAHQDALLYYNRALQLFQPDAWEERYQLLLACRYTYTMTGNWEKEEETLQRLTTCAEQLDDDAKRLQVLAEYVFFYRRRRQDRELEIAYAQALPLAQKLKDIQCEFDLVLARTVRLGESLKFDEAFASLAKCKRLYDRLGTADARLSYLMTLALIHFDTDELDKSISIQQEYLQLAEKENVLFSIFRGSSNIGTVYQTKGEFALAEQYYQRASQVAHQRGDMNGQAVVLINMGDLYTIIGQYEEAILTFEKVLSLSQQIGRWFFYRLGLTNLGWAKYKLGEWAEAEAVLQEVIDRNDKANDRRNGAIGWNKMGHLFLGTQRLFDALNAFQAAVSLQADVSQTATLIETWAGLAGCYGKLGDMEQANDYAGKAWAAIKDEVVTDSWEWAQSILYMYEVLSQCDAELAQEILEKAYGELQKRAMQFTSEARRETFLTGVPQNHRLVLLYEALS